MTEDINKHKAVIFLVGHMLSKSFDEWLTLQFLYANIINGFCIHYWWEAL